MGESMKSLEFSQSAVDMQKELNEMKGLTSELTKAERVIDEFKLEMERLQDYLDFLEK